MVQAVPDHEISTGTAAVDAWVPRAGMALGAVVVGGVRVLTVKSYTLGELVSAVAGSLAVNLKT